ncbi:putative P450 monooxygenase [Polychaeton citri CBS 116435]|uniref:P450 monooxygenase n=1 Tax=Polychaeton citri CBS 116435 TaxID=1314669 RepID=A0A9P4UMB8_9PEZI|nr:putative P450 monooxygenase [Polychaeton citri CBS 116435]
MVQELLYVSLAGVATHRFYFKHGEHHMWGMTYILLFLLVFVLSIAGLVRLHHYPINSAIKSVSVLATTYFTGLYTSLAIYRLYFHPLCIFPGPWQARLSSLWLMSRMLNFDAYHKLEALHKQYGRYVVVGSNDLSISDPDIMDAAYGALSQASKSQWYDTGRPHDSMHTTRERAVHDRRRRIWAPGFSDKALREYEVRVNIFNAKLMQRVRENAGKPIDATKWFSLYAFDVMGALTFGKDYGMLDAGELHWAAKLIVDTMEAAGPRPPAWLIRVAIAIPGVMAGFHKFLRFCRDELHWRYENRDKKDVDGSDIAGWLMKAYEGWDKPPADDPMFQGDARLVIVAGSDTTSAALTYLFYELCKKPEEVTKMREELKAARQGSNDSGDKVLRNAQHLNGAINEAMRLHPSVPSGLERVTRPEGLRYGEHGEKYIPGNVHFWVPQYVLGRDEEFYTSALDFIPERWYSRPEMIKHKHAFAPFSMGPHGCIGKNLALMQLRTLVAQLVLEFDVAFAPGENGNRVIYETKDHFTLSLGQLDLVFTPVRKS